MIKQWIFFFTLILTSLSCKKGPPDGNYCAKVLYQHPEHKGQSSYTLIVEVKDNQLIDISFPEEHYDHSAIKAVKIPIDGKVTVVSQSGSVYKVEMKGPAEECLKAINMLQCKGTSKEGKRCKRFTPNKNGLCWQHKNQETQ